MKNNFDKTIEESFLSGSNSAASSILSKFESDMEKFTGLKYNVSRKEMSENMLICKYDVLTSTDVHVGMTCVNIYTDTKGKIASVSFFNNNQGVHESMTFSNFVAYKMNEIYNPSEAPQPLPSGKVYYSVNRPRHDEDCCDTVEKSSNY